MLATRVTGACWTSLRLGIVEYAEAWDIQARLVEQRQRDEIPDTLVLLEHPHTYTFGRRAVVEHLLLGEGELKTRGIATHWVDRGGDITYHGPGQIVGYPIVDLRRRALDVHKYLRALEEVLIQALATYDIEAERDPAYTGVWVSRPAILTAAPAILSGAKNLEGERGDRTSASKIAAIGVKISRGVTSHGFALNVSTDLSYFTGIIPCGITDRPVTSMEAVLGEPVDLPGVEAAIEAAFGKVFADPSPDREGAPRRLGALHPGEAPVIPG